MEELIYASATMLARAIRAREVSSEEVVETYLRRIKEVNPKLNAVVQLTEDTALNQAREADTSLERGHIKGPLHGVPMTVKDNIEIASVTCTGGTKGRASFVPTQDATVVARMRAAGAIVLGKTNLPELALAFQTDNLIYGRTNNPYDLSRTPGGSSGGEAAIIAAGGSPLGLGNDMGGSIRLPSHFCGIAGIKPTSGRVPLTGLFLERPRGGVTDALWHVGPMARFIEDLILILPIISGVDWRDPTVVPMPLKDPTTVDLKSLRGAFHTDNGILSPTPETIEAVRNVAKTLSDAGMTMGEARPGNIEQTSEIFGRLLTADGGAGIQLQLQIAGTNEMHPRTARILRANAMTTPEFGRLMEKWAKFRSSMLSFMEKYDVIICPVCATPASSHGDIRGGSFSYTMTYNLTGWPSVVVRSATSPEGLPIGVQVVARPWCEHVALAVAQHVETVMGGWQRPPI